jgi:hypothetical protein
LLVFSSVEGVKEGREGERRGEERREEKSWCKSIDERKAKDEMM